MSDKKIRLFLISQFISIFGSLLVQYAISWYVALQTNTGSSFALITVCGFLPQALIAPFGGVLADRTNRKHLIMLADSAVALSTLFLALFLLFKSHSLTAIYVCSIIRSIGAGIQTPTVNAIIPQLFPKDQLMKANAIFTTMMSILGISAPALAGIILKYAKFQYVLMIDVVTGLTGVLIFSFIKLKKHDKAMEKNKPSPFVDLAEGFKYSFSDPFLRRFLLIMSLFMFIIVVPSSLNILLIIRVFGEDTIYLTINEICYFAGGGIGGIILTKWGGFKNRVDSWFLGLIIFGITTVGIGLIPVLWIYMGVIAICGLSMPLCNGVPYTILQENITDSNIHGRVFGIMNVIQTLILPVGIAILGPLADIVDIRVMTVISGVALIALAMFTRCSDRVYEKGIPPFVEKPKS
jgi:DHA3 family macrolide efflux protein-like MFS transporter